MKRFILAIICILAAGGPSQAQVRQESLAGLIQAGDRKAALEAIRAGADVNEAQPDGTRPIHWAVYRADYELVEALIAREARANVTNAFGSTPLAEAVRLVDSRMVGMLLDAGSGPEGANEDGQTALMLAIRAGDVELVQMLVDAGANVNAVEMVQQQTPLMWAAAANRNAAAMVGILIGKGANVNARAKFNDWPSQITSEPRAQYHSYGGLTPLLFAARNGCDACVEALIDAGADVNRPAPEGITPLMIALDNGHNGTAKLLLDRGANPHLWDVYGRTALYIAVDREAAGGGGGGAGGAGGPDGRGAEGEPSVSSMDVVLALLDAGVDPNPQLSMRRPSGQGGRFSDPLLSTGTTPLLRAVMNNDMDVIRALLDKGADPNIIGMGTTPFLIAAGANSYGPRGGGGANVNTALLDLLIEHGADVNTQVTGTRTYSMRLSRQLSNVEGMSALHAAVAANKVDLVRYLLDRGARTDLVDVSGRTPLDVADGVPARPVPPDAGAAIRSTENADTDYANPVAPAASAAPGPRAGAAPAVSLEIRTLLQNAAQRQNE